MRFRFAAFVLTASLTGTGAGLARITLPPDPDPPYSYIGSVEGVKFEWRNYHPSYGPDYWVSERVTNTNPYKVQASWRSRFYRENEAFDAGTTAATFGPGAVKYGERDGLWFVPFHGRPATTIDISEIQVTPSF